MSLRKDRFFSGVPGVSQDDFRKTQYLKYYDRTPPLPEKHSVAQTLRDLSIGTYSILMIINEMERASSDHDAIRIYSSDLRIGFQSFYSFVNEQLHKDDSTMISKLIPFIRRATSQIKYHAPFQSYVVYRGLNLTASQKTYFTIGKIFRFPGFTSTSKSEIMARRFGNCFFQIHIPAGCLQVRDISAWPNVTHGRFWSKSCALVLAHWSKEGYNLILQVLS